MAAANAVLWLARLAVSRGMVVACHCRVSEELVLLVAGREPADAAFLQALGESPGKEVACIHRYEEAVLDTHDSDDRAEDSGKACVDLDTVAVCSSQVRQRGVAAAVARMASAGDRQ